ncbi:MAG: hypothetical protein ACI9MC_001882 [Kiritimatiellia bacterium]|jgi:hypothetical protein
MRILCTTVLAAIALTACTSEVSIDRNVAPSADTGQDIDQPANLPVFLDGRASYDADGDELVFHWTLEHAPSDSALPSMVNPFSTNHDEASATTRFQPDVQGVFIVSLMTKDSDYYSEPSYVIVTATEPSEIPQANAGNDQTLAIDSTAYLDGGQSIDPMGGVLNYAWTLVERPYNSTLDVDSVDNSDQRQAEFAADVAGRYSVALVVANGMADSDASTVSIDFVGTNEPPEADAGGDFSAMDCEPDVLLDCSGSTDPNKDRLYYWWVVQSVPEGSAVDNRSFTNQNAADPNIFFDIAGEYTVSCSVFDGQAWSRPDTIKVAVAERDYNEAPIIDPGPDQVVDGGEVDCETITLPYYPYTTSTTCDSCPADSVEVGKSIKDADSDPYTVEWTVIRDSKVRLLGATDELIATVQTPKITPNKKALDEDLSFVRVTVTDCTGESQHDDVEITTQCTGT